MDNGWFMKIKIMVFVAGVMVTVLPSVVSAMTPAGISCLFGVGAVYARRFARTGVLGALPEAAATYLPKKGLFRQIMVKPEASWLSSSIFDRVAAASLKNKIVEEPKIAIVDFDRTRDYGFVVALCVANFRALDDRPDCADFKDTLEIERMRSKAGESPDSVHLRIKVMYEGEVPVGYISYAYTPKELAYIANIVVSDSVRKQGYARRLFEYAQEEVQKNGCDRLILMVSEDNESFVSDWYKRKGFGRVGVHPGHYGLDAVMVKQLKNSVK